MNDKTMFCRQCQETFGNTGCTRGSVCGKKPATSALMDELLALLSLGFRNIRLGPTHPAFLSPGVANVLSARFGLR